MEKLVSLDRNKIYRDLWRLSWPVMTFMVFQSTLELVDVFWIGRLGTTSLAAFTISNGLFWLLFTLSQIVTIPTLALTARYRGADNPGGAITAARHSFWMAVALSVLVIALVFGLGDLFISFYDADPEVHAQALVYLKVVGVSMAFAYGSMAMGASLQGVGDTRTPMAIQIITNIINIVLDPILIMGMFGFPALGILGAALATLVARGMGFSIMLYIIISGKISPSKLQVNGLFSFKFQKAYFKRLIEIGLPACLQAMTRPMTSLLLLKIVSLFGTESIAAIGIGMRFLGLSFIAIAGMTVGTSTMVGQSLGADLKDLTGEIIRKAMVIAVAVQGLTAALCFFAAPYIIGFFADDPAVIQSGTAFLRIISPGLVIMGLSQMIDSVFKGSGYTIPSMVSAFIANWLIMLPGAYFIAFVLGLSVNGIWWAITFSFFAELALLLTWYRRGRWQHREIRVLETSQPNLP